ncbi:DUF1330 domain-containing protein [Neisseriaceae bacterium TC5R-5]|nr:DUF1330 domain-containing protein [Neisseriaceae bacterium TC5R-5]
MRYEMLVGLNVLDEARYQTYRTLMSPILSTYGGGFAYDFKVSQVLLPEAEKEINRVFTIYFRDHAAMQAFFADPAYLEVKKHHFDTAVGKMVIIASYEQHAE